METVLLEKIPPENRSLYRFFESLRHAASNGLHYEFMESFLLDYSGTGDINSAIDFAEREWDL